jgi:hypothetical protein
MWEGWLEFVPIQTGNPEVLVSPVESRQPEREHLVYWASGLSDIYAQGALARARLPLTVRTRIVDVAASEEPAPRIVSAPTEPVSPEPILDPFEAGARSLDVLRQELGALGRARLLNIIAAFSLNPANSDVSWMTDAQLITFIVTAVDAQMKARR